MLHKTPKIGCFVFRTHYLHRLERMARAASNVLVQLLQSGGQSRKLDSFIFVTNNPEETLDFCNTSEDEYFVNGFWNSRAILGPLPPREAVFAGKLLMTGTRGYQSKARKIDWISQQYDLPLYMGNDTMDTGLELKHWQCKRRRVRAAGGLQ